MWHNKYVGIAFAEKGRTVEAVDCWGLVCIVYQQELGIALPSFDDCYSNTNDKETIAPHISRQRASDWRDVEKPQPFDIVILRVAGLPIHVGIVTTYPFMIHSAQEVDVALERLDGTRWKDRVLGYVRHHSR